MSVMHFIKAVEPQPNPMSRYPAKLSVLSIAWRGSVEHDDEQLLGFTVLNVDRAWSTRGDDYQFGDRAFVTFDPDARDVLIDRFVSALRLDAVLVGNHLSTDLPRLACFAKRADPALFAPLIEKLHDTILSSGILDAHKLLPSNNLPDEDLFALMSELVRGDVHQQAHAIASENASLLAAYMRERIVLASS